MKTISAHEIRRFRNALPFWLSLGMVPLAYISTMWGGWYVLLMVFYSWGMFSLIDIVAGNNLNNADTSANEDDLFWYRLITLIWTPVQFLVLFSAIWYVPQAGHLNNLEKIGLFFSIGTVTSNIGINYAHELVHQKSNLERWLGDILLSMVLYSHFRSEHLRVHHIYVGTPKDPVTARYNEGFWSFWARVAPQCLFSSWDAEKKLLKRKNLSVWHGSNPFWRYGILQFSMLSLALFLGGIQGILLFLLQAIVAIWQLELVNYIEHYGLTRRYLGNGKYEHVLPQHSWNTAKRASNWLLINLQRHSDHHYKPDRRFPLLQNHDKDAAPQLPFGYPIMGIFAMVPILWRRVMNPRVLSWRKKFYADITDWKAYDEGTTPLPR